MKIRLLTCTAIAFFSTSTVVFAAEDMTTQSQGGSDIVVTANKRLEASASVPATVFTLTGNAIAQAKVRDLFDVTAMIPIFRVEQQEASAQTNFLIRGFGNGDNNVGIEPSVGVFIDGVYRSRSAAQISDLIDVDQVDIQAGPQTTLFGKNASEGVVSITTKSPSFKTGAEAQISYGNYNAVTIKGTVTGPLTSNLAARISASLDRDDGYATNLTSGTKTNNRNRWSVRGQLLWTPTRDFKLRIIADADRINERCCAVENLVPSDATALINAIGGQVNTPDQGHHDQFYSNYDPTNDIRNRGISAQVDYTVGHINITSISAWRNMVSDTNQDADFTSADILGDYRQHLRINTFTQEIRAASNYDGPFNFLTGIYLFKENIRQQNAMSWGSQMRSYADGLIQGLSSQLGSPTTLPDVESNLSLLTGTPLSGQLFAQGEGQYQQYSLNNNAFSIFGQGDFKPVKGLQISVGANLIRDVKHYTVNINSTDVLSNLSLPDIANGAIAAGIPQDQALSLLALAPFQLMPSAPAVPNSVENGRTADTHATWSVKAIYQLTPRMNAYVNVSTGFKPSSINLSRDSRPSANDAAALVAAGLAPAPTTNVAGLPIVNAAYGSRFSNPETSILYEAGLKGRWQHLALNVAIFKQIIKDFQSVVFTGTGFYLQNAGKENNWGLEANANIEPTKGLSLTAASAWYNPHYTSFLNSSIGDLTGTKPANIPSLSLTLGARYQTYITTDSKLSGRISWHYESPTKIIEGLPGEIVRDPITQAAISYQPAIDMADRFKRTVEQIDASITYSPAANIEISGWVRNLTNDRYLIGVIDSPAQTGSISGYYNRPRTYGLSIGYTW